MQMQSTWCSWAAELLGSNLPDHSLIPGTAAVLSVKQQKAVTVHSVERVSSEQISLHCITTSKRYYARNSLKQWESSAGFPSPMAVLLSQTEPRASNRHLATLYCT